MAILGFAAFGRGIEGSPPQGVFDTFPYSINPSTPSMRKIDDGERKRKKKRKKKKKKKITVEIVATNVVAS